MCFEIFQSLTPLVKNLEILQVYGDEYILAPLCTVAQLLSSGEAGKKAMPKVKHHEFFAERYVELQFIPLLRKVIVRLLQGKTIIAIGSHFSKLM